MGSNVVPGLFATIATSAAVAAVVGPLVSEALRRLRERGADRLAALAAAVELEGYAIRCAEGVAEHDNALSSDGNVGELLSAVPDIAQIEMSPAFIRPAKAEIAGKIAAFPQEVRQSQQAGAFWLDIIGEPDSTQNEIMRQTSLCGSKALALAGSLRTEFNLPSRELTFGAWNIEETLRRTAVSHAPK